jgi:hypothetical protein
VRYFGALGLVQQSEVRPGIWEEAVTEVPVLGTVRQVTAILAGEGNVLPEYTTTTSITVPARGVGPQDTSMIRYITYKGLRWQVRSIVDEPPRIVIYIGEVYRGPTPE